MLEYWNTGIMGPHSIAFINVVIYIINKSWNNYENDPKFLIQSMKQWSLAIIPLFHHSMEMALVNQYAKFYDFN